MGTHVGYVRVNSHGQNAERQLDGVTLAKVFEEKASAKTTARPQLQSMVQDEEIGLDDDGMLASRLKNKTVAP